MPWALMKEEEEEEEEEEETVHPVGSYRKDKSRCTVNKRLN
jgi:hypothetical protein